MVCRVISIHLDSLAIALRGRKLSREGKKPIFQALYSSNRYFMRKALLSPQCIVGSFEEEHHH